MSGLAMLPPLYVPYGHGTERLGRAPADSGGQVLLHINGLRDSSEQRRTGFKALGRRFDSAHLHHTEESPLARAFACLPPRIIRPVDGRMIPPVQRQDWIGTKVISTR